MAESFLTLMADYDEAAQETFAAWQRHIDAAGFAGTHTRDIPYHISLATFDLADEAAAIALTRCVAAAHAPLEVDVTHMGLFTGGKVLFAAPDVNARLQALRQDCSDAPVGAYPWTPHTTLLIDEPAVVAQAVPMLTACFRPFRARITRLHLCAFWPTREILTAELTGKA
ncbi:MAG: 2'-5' RNA ligase family protein [Clostridia bacterium]|nr:2'-5' RNA ligase family protein [Clostridia bacterium]